MKANRKFKNKDDDAVSAVIGVILMVAITVAIAATVYVYVSGMIGGTSSQTPALTFTPQNADDRLVVASADSSLDWGDISVSHNFNGSISVEIAGESAQILHKGQTMDINITGGSKVVSAGDYLLVNSELEDEPSGNVAFTFVYEPTNSLMGTWTLNV